MFLASTGASSLRGIDLAAVELSAACARSRASAGCVHECTCFEDTFLILATVDAEDRILARMLPLPYPFCMQEWLQQVLSAASKMFGVATSCIATALLQRFALLCAPAADTGMNRKLHPTVTPSQADHSLAGPGLGKRVLRGIHHLCTLTCHPPQGRPPMRWCGRRRRDDCQSPGSEGYVYCCTCAPACAHVYRWLLLDICSTMAGQRAHTCMRCTPYSIPWPHGRGVCL